MEKLFKGTLITLFITLLVILGAGAVSAATWNVGTGPGNDSTTIAGAIAMASDGDTILVHETGSNYVENIQVNRENLVIQADSTAVTIDGSGANNEPVVRIPDSGSGTTIDGFTITGASGGDNAIGVHIQNADYCWIINNIITGNERQGIRVRGDATNNNIHDNTITENGRNGILVTGESEDTNIFRNTIENNEWNGIELDQEAEDTQIIGNTILNNGRNGILIDGSDEVTGVTAKYNRIYGHTDGTYFDFSNKDENYLMADARYNWWGSNNDPVTQIEYDAINVLYNPWLYLTFTANPTSIVAGATSTLTASFNNLFDGTTVTPFNPTDWKTHIPDGTPVTFTTTLGKLGSDMITAYTASGVATATLTANEGPGIAYLTAYLDALVLNPLTATVTITAVPVSAASTTKTIGMQTTGASIIPLVLASLLILGGLIVPRKK